MYKDNHRKFVAVLNRNIEPAKLMNALAHCSGGGAALFGAAPLEFQQYVDASGAEHCGISRFPWIILQSKNSNQLRTLRTQAIAQRIHVTDFVSSMLGQSAEDQVEMTRRIQEAELEYYVVCLFGDAEDIDPLTRKFSIFH